VKLQAVTGKGWRSVVIWLTSSRSHCRLGPSSPLTRRHHHCLHYTTSIRKWQGTDRTVTVWRLGHRSHLTLACLGKARALIRGCHRLTQMTSLRPRLQRIRRIPTRSTVLKMETSTRSSGKSKPSCVHLWNLRIGGPLGAHPYFFGGPGRGRNRAGPFPATTQRHKGGSRWHTGVGLSERYVRKHGSTGSQEYAKNGATADMTILRTRSCRCGKCGYRSSSFPQAVPRAWRDSNVLSPALSTPP
jgi:hypothetical protein